MEMNSVCFLEWTCLCFHQIYSVWYLGQSCQELGCHCFFYCNSCYFNTLLCFTFFSKIDCSYPEFCVGPGVLECFSYCYFSTIFFYLILDDLTSICSLACLSKQYTTVSYFLLNMKLHIGTE